MHSFPLPPLGGFPTAEANSKFYVYDPTTDSVWSRSIFIDLPLSVSSQFRSTNMQAEQEGNTLYIVGGYGKDSIGSLDTFITFPKLSAINISGMVNAIKTNSTVAPFIRQITDTMLAVTGGDFFKMGSFYYLTVGQKFTGKYAFPNSGPPLFEQQYTNCIKKFNIVDNGISLSLANISYLYDSVNLHRRDLNVVPQITSQAGTEGLTIYGGVFQYDEDVPFVNPVYIGANSISVENVYTQRFSQYECPVIPFYDSTRNNMSNILMGGLSLYRYDTVEHKAVIDTCNFGGPAPCVPFISDLTVITKFGAGNTKDSILPIRFPQNRMLGAEMKLVLDQSLPMYPNEVIKLSRITGRTFIGYIHGGIEAVNSNPFLQMLNSRGRISGQGSLATSSIFKIYITPNSVGINPLGNFVPGDYSLYQNYPNPFNPVTRIKFEIPASQFVNIKVYDVLGKEVENLVNENLKAGSYEVEFNGSHHASGIYYYKITTDNFKEVRKMMLVK